MKHVMNRLEGGDVVGASFVERVGGGKGEGSANGIGLTLIRILTLFTFKGSNTSYIRSTKIGYR